jgi:hypothetical protein
LLDNNRKRERECRALARLRFDPDFAAVHLDDALSQQILAVPVGLGSSASFQA